MSNDKVNYNMLALMGDDTTDEEYIQMYNLPLRLANTPEINEEILKAQYAENVQHHVDNGMQLREAEAKAGEVRSKSKNNLNRLMANKGLLK
jgi:hypothetical protein